MIGFESTYEGLSQSGYLHGWSVWSNWLFFAGWAWVLLLMVRWTWRMSYIRLRGRGILPDMIVSALASASMFVTHPWLGHVHDQNFMIAFFGVLSCYSFIAAYYYRKIVLGIQDWGKLRDRR